MQLQCAQIIHVDKFLCGTLAIGNVVAHWWVKMKLTAVPYY